MNYKAIVIGASAGGMKTIGDILRELPLNFTVPIIIVQHLSPNSKGYMPNYLNKLTDLIVKEADEKEKILPGVIYVSPANYHLLVENNETLSLTVEPKVNYSRPAIDLLFETASDVYRDKLIGIILTGANKDGSLGLKRIKERGGLTIVEDPDSAAVNTMPKAAIAATTIDYILKADEITQKIIELVGYENERR